MPPALIQSCRLYLSRQYREMLGWDLVPSIQQLHVGNQPVWRFVSNVDLTSEVDQSQAHAAVLLDPEIGIAAYFIAFDSKLNLRRQVLRALNLRSSLRTEANNEDSKFQRDSRGAWRIVLHWLVDGALAKSEWIDKIMELRGETAFSEELTFDGIFYSGGDFMRRLEEHGVPRLLLTTREVFRKETIADTDQWMSANNLVLEALERFPRGFNAPEQREAASEVLKAVADHRSRVTPANVVAKPSNPHILQNIRVKHFRNLGDVSLDFGGDVDARIIHGPNGTGKSSLCEAISIALFKSSGRYARFVNKDTEKDVTSTDRRSTYIADYLNPLNKPASNFSIILNGVEVDGSLASAELARDVDGKSCGTILTQDGSEEFARMSSAELGARILTGYSDLADYVREIIESRYTQATAARQDFLRQLNLPASITKMDTARQRLARAYVDKKLPAFPEGLVAWLQRTGDTTLFEEANRLISDWNSWGGHDARERVSKQLSEHTDASMAHLIRGYLDQYNLLIDRTEQLSGSVRRNMNFERSRFDDLKISLSKWGEWLQNRNQQRTTAQTSGENEEQVEKLQNLRKQQQEIVKQGQHLNAHLEHLSRVVAFVKETWPDDRKTECPSCGAVHPEGITESVDALVTSVTTKRDELRGNYEELKTQIEAIQRLLAASAGSICPVSAEEQANVLDAFGWLIRPGVPLEQIIADGGKRERLITTITTIRHAPLMPARVDPEIESERATDALGKQFTEAEQIFEAPNNWKPVKDKLTETLAEIVKLHLPNTLARLWCEVAMNLTSAPWLLPASPQMEVKTRRGEQKASITIEGKLARYVLNQAEIHVLGLAWFFTKYLTVGRFHHACIIMDDPAQEMDQTSFRDLCRLLETWVRIHTVYSRPLKLVVFLNQESRALDAARATGGVLGVLGWRREQQESLSQIRVVGDGFYAPQPTKLFA